MNDTEIRRVPAALRGIVADTEAVSFNMISESKVGSLLAALAASKPGGRLLELGTGTGHGTAWLLAGMGVWVDARCSTGELGRRRLATA
jgi:predicted O-methyltransferase YrrM